LRTSKQPNFDGVLFLDCTHQSKIARKLLGALACPAEFHKTHFKPDTPDDERIPVCAGRDWIIVSGDKGIVNDGINRAAVERSKAKVFILADTESSGADWAASIALGARKIFCLARTNEGPFYCNVKMGGDSHVGKVEFLPGGRPKAVEVTPPPIKETQTNISMPKSRKTQETQASQPPLEFPD